MSTPIKKTRKVVGNVQGQIEGIRKSPGLAEGLPFSADGMKEKLDRVLQLMQDHQATRKAAAMMTRLVNEAVFELDEAFHRNLGAVESQFGRYAPELGLIGGRPLKGSRGGRKSSPASPAAPTGIGPAAPTA